MKLVFNTPLNGHFFSGYYDKSPLNSKNEILVSLKANFINRLPGENDTAELGAFIIDEKKEFVSVDRIRSFNWQQGNMLQWLGPDHANRIIYNNYENKKFISKIFNFETNENVTIEEPIYCVTKKGDLAFSVDFERHFWCRRGYAYSNIEAEEKNVKILERDGINKLDLNSGFVNKIINIETLIDKFNVNSMKNSTNWLEHIMANPSGSRIAFLHRWRLDSGEIFAHLISSDTEGNNLRLLNNSGRFSHFCWKDDHSIFGWGSYNSQFASFRKNLSFLTPIMPLAKKVYRSFIKSNPQEGLTSISAKLTGDSYLSIRDSDGRTEKLNDPNMNKDGHPSFSPSNISNMITDTYPDNGKAQLIFYDLDLTQIKSINILNSIEQFDNTACRCDLHPKWSFDGNYISIDTMDQGVRSIYVYNLED